MAEVKIGEASYRTGRLSGRVQLHIGRKLAPALLEYGQAVSMLDKALKGTEENSVNPFGDIASAFRPVAEAFAKLSEADADYVMGHCLFVCERELPTDPGKWARVAVPVAAEAGYYRLMHEDMGAKVMSQLAMEVIRENLTGFF